MITTLISGLQYFPHNTSWFNKCMSLKCKGCSCLTLRIMLSGYVTANIEVQSQTWFSIRVKIWVFQAIYVIIAQQQKCIVLKRNAVYSPLFNGHCLQADTPTPSKQVLSHGARDMQTLCSQDVMFLKRTFFLSKNLCWSQKTIVSTCGSFSRNFLVFVFFLRSVGCILYELFVGTPPFYTNSIFQLVNLICRVHVTLSVWYFLMCTVKTHE